MKITTNQISQFIKEYDRYVNFARKIDDKGDEIFTCIKEIFCENKVYYWGWSYYEENIKKPQIHRNNFGCSSYIDWYIRAEKRLDIRDKSNNIIDICCFFPAHWLQLSKEQIKKEIITGKKDIEKFMTSLQKPPMPPTPPPNRLILEWSACGICKTCGSSLQKHGLFGPIKCIQPLCKSNKK